MIKGILYDLGDIFFEAHLWREWMFDYFVRLNLFSGTFRDFYYLYEEYLVPVYNGKISYEKAYISFIEHLNVPDTKKFMADSFKKKEYYEKTRQLYPEVKDTLERLRNKNIKNIVITDNELSETDLREKVIERFGINHLLDKVVTSSETGISKPDPAIFIRTLESVGFGKNDVLFVAHDKDEIDGAKSLGLNVVEFNNYLNEKTKANIKIRCFKELLDYI